ncbi:MAG: invasion associated locus B family protein [Rhodobacteraceae bacterium]|nr:invasion associated locus B family protein [Paracoccaceae bacterium]
MKTHVARWMLCCGLIFSAPALAQTGATKEEAPGAEVTPHESSAQDTRNTSDEQFPVSGEPQSGEDYLREQHEAWEVRCIRGEEGEQEICQLYVLIYDSDGASVAEFFLTALPPGGKAAAGVDVATPLGTLLTKQVLLKIDSGKTNRYPFTWCNQLACYARFGLTSTQVDAMKRGSTAQITVFSIQAPEEPIQLSLSLNGFTAAWNAVAPK